MLPRPPLSTLFPYTTLFRSDLRECDHPESSVLEAALSRSAREADTRQPTEAEKCSLVNWMWLSAHQDRKSTRLNSSHTVISYAVFCLKKKNQDIYKDIIQEN